MRPFVVEVTGVPAPQGSKVRTRYGMREASKRVKPWREQLKGRVGPGPSPSGREA